MISIDFTKLSRKELIKFFEKERHEWLDYGMNEADIFRIHFGEQEENGRGGDYRMWLEDRRYARNDYKYAPGAVIAIDIVDSDSNWLKSNTDCIDEIEFNFDLEIALSVLTDLQRTCFVNVRLKGWTQADLACELGVSRENVKQSIEGAIKKIKKYFR